MSLRGDEIPTRPDYGTKGTPIKLRTNFFPVRVPKGPIHEYDISISPVQGTAAKRQKRRIFHLAEQTQDWAQNGLRGRVAHDHSSKLVSAHKLPQPCTVRVPFYEEEDDGPTEGGREYTLTITYKEDIDTQSLLQYVSSEFHCCGAPTHFLTFASGTWPDILNTATMISPPSWRRLTSCSPPTPIEQRAAGVSWSVAIASSSVQRCPQSPSAVVSRPGEGSTPPFVLLSSSSW